MDYSVIEMWIDWRYLHAESKSNLKLAVHNTKMLTNLFALSAGTEKGPEILGEAAAEDAEEEGGRRWRQGQEEEVVQRKGP